MSGKVLIVDDDRGMCEFLSEALVRRGFEASAATSAQEGLNQLISIDFDCVVTDIHMPEMNGLELCARISGSRPDIPVIILTSFGSMDSAVAAIRGGAYDFITKPIEIEPLILSLRRAVERRRLSEEVRRLSRVRTQSHSSILGDSAPIKRLRELIARSSEVDVPILIQGESGSGKELVAREIHNSSSRHAAPFLTLNMSAIPDALFERELFGHLKGSFTGAQNDHTGLFAQAQGGTLFLDEVADIPTVLQPKLLRVIQEKKVRPLGSAKEFDFSARIICATNRDLEELIEKSIFRQDLYYRINVISIQVPPLRIRGNDILLLAQNFIEVSGKRQNKAVKGMARAVAEKLLAYPWPGNIRELSNCIERAVTLTPFETITLEDLPERIAAHSSNKITLEGFDASSIAPMADVERRYILYVLSVMDGNRRLTADALGMDRKTLYRKLEQFKKECGDLPESKEG